MTEPTAPEPEMIDLYDDQRRKTGSTLPRGTFLHPGTFQLYALALVQNQDGKYLITRRSQNESWGAGWWEIPGGGVLAGETPEQTIVREILEETSLDISACPLKRVYTYKSENPALGHNYFTDIFLVQTTFTEEDIHLETTEEVAFRLASWNDIQQLGEEGIFLHYNHIATILGE